MQEQARVPSQGAPSGWLDDDLVSARCADGHGDTVRIGEQLAREHFPPEAFTN